jgi:hypothetical protein
MEMFSTFKKMMAHDATVTTLFHGTSPVAVLKIIESGFDKVPAHRREEAFRMNDGGWTQQVQNIKAHVES